MSNCGGTFVLDSNSSCWKKSWLQQDSGIPSKIKFSDMIFGFTLDAEKTTRFLFILYATQIWNNDLKKKSFY